MGGNAMKHVGVETRRMSKKEYYKTVDEVKELLTRYCPYLEMDEVPSYRNKADFGDLDLLVKKDQTNSRPPMQQIIRDVFNPKGLVHNSDVISFDYNGFQVDVISTSVESYDFALSYYSWNDLGNLIGRVAHKMALKFGHDGLWYYCRNGTHMFRDILVTRDLKQALDLLGFSHERFTQGFDSLQDIFEYVSGSQFFNTKLYLLENRNHRDRTRDKKRKTHMEFLDWLEVTPIERQYAHPEDKAEWLPHIFSYFPQFKIDYNKAQDDLALHQLFKEKYNGELVSAITDLKEKELGMFMHWMRERSEKYDFTNWVLTHSSEEIEALVSTELGVYFKERRAERAAIIEQGIIK
jgi:hypothetical protein